jgi:hypothetical protein
MRFSRPERIVRFGGPECIMRFGGPGRFATIVSFAGAEYFVTFRPGSDEAGYFVSVGVLTIAGP